MANPQLDSKNKKKHFDPLFSQISKKLSNLAKRDPNLAWAVQRKLWKQISYLERGTPALRKKLKTEKWVMQKKKCAHCKEALKKKGSILDRRKAIDGYTAKNTRLLHPACDRKIQKQRGFK